MTSMEQKLILKIRNSDDPDGLMDYIEKLLSPQCQEALEEPSVPQES